MNLTEAQKKDIETIKYFIPKEYKKIPIIDSSVRRFLDKSERGIGDDRSMFAPQDGYDALMQGKRWRGWHMRMWEEGVLEGTFPYYGLLGGLDGERRKWWEFWKPIFYNKKLPRSVVDFMKKEMFKGQDAEFIESVYSKL